MRFSLFDKEEKIIQQAEELVARQDYSCAEITECLLSLIEAFRRSYKEQKRLIRVSDRQQEQLRSIKEELLAKADELEVQALALKTLNADLEAEIATRKKIEEKLRIIAHTDALTGINNRRRFLELLKGEIRRAERTGLPLSMMMIDIDYFKNVNDRFGHVVGDQALRHFVTVSLSSLRDIDIIGRLGGEEFGVLLTGTSRGDAFIVAERLRREIENREFLSAGKEINITVSIGLTELITGESEDQLIKRADAAMYMAKQNGRNRVEIA